MAILYMTCDCCGETFSENSPHAECENGHTLCKTCLEEEDLETNEDGYVEMIMCPCCCHDNDRSVAYNRVIDLVEHEVDESTMKEIIDNLNVLL